MYHQYSYSINICILWGQSTGQTAVSSIYKGTSNQNQKMWCVKHWKTKLAFRVLITSTMYGVPPRNREYLVAYLSVYVSYQTYVCYGRSPHFLGSTWGSSAFSLEWLNMEGDPQPMSCRQRHVLRYY